MTDGGSQPSTTVTARRSIVVSLGLIVVGVLVAVIAASRDWMPGDVSVVVSARGNSYSRPVTAIAMTSLAAGAALFAARGLWRSALSWTIVSLGLLIGGVATTSDAVGNSWYLIATVAGLLIALGGGVAVRHGRQWPSMSNRYEREARAAAKPLTAWDAIDRGEDPTS